MWPHRPRRNCKNASVIGRLLTTLACLFLCALPAFAEDNAPMALWTGKVDGKPVRILIASTELKPGAHTFLWEGPNDGSCDAAGVLRARHGEGELASASFQADAATGRATVGLGLGRSGRWTIECVPPMKSAADGRPISFELSLDEADPPPRFARRQLVRAIVLGALAIALIVWRIRC